MWARCLDAGVIGSLILLSLLQVRFLQNGPELSRARRLGAAERTLYSEDRSETIPQEGKEELPLDSISEAQQAKRLHICGNHSSI
jgi:hypothetical protein